MTEYVNLSPSYKNPADTSSKQGAKLTIDNTAYWNGQNMRRTELIPQTSAAINSGKVYYHFSMMRSSTNAPNAQLEHQVCFFESHFTEMKYGLLSSETGSGQTSDRNLRWMVNSQSQWSTSFDPGVWHNIAYEIVSRGAYSCYSSLLTITGFLCWNCWILAFDWLESAHPDGRSGVSFNIIKWCRLASGCSTSSNVLLAYDARR